MSDENLKMLIRALGGQVLENESDPTGMVAMLISETTKFRDKLKEDTGEILTVADTRVALDALEDHLQGRPLPGDLSPEQKALTQIYIDRITLFRKE
jgi:hypothetical protein